MRKTLYLLWIIIASPALRPVRIFFAVATVISRITMEYCVRDKARLLYGEATHISDTYATDLYNSRVSLEIVQAQMEALSAYMDTEIWILNPSGRMIVNSRQAIPIPPKRPSSRASIPLLQPETTIRPAPFLIPLTKRSSSVTVPITGSFKIHGYVVIHMPMEKVRRDADGILNIAYMELALLIVLSLIILLFFTEYVYRPLRRIIAAAEQYALGNMHYHIPVEREDELGYLAASLGYMADTIARSEDDQKKFIANISHDFRSPLTSIHGFLEAMLDGTIPPERYEHYLGVVLAETERLTKLTNGLLTLNNLTTGGMLLNRTDFDINARDPVCGRLLQRDRPAAPAISTSTPGSSGQNTCLSTRDLEKIQQVLCQPDRQRLKIQPSGF